MFKVESENIRDLYFVNHVSNAIVMSERSLWTVDTIVWHQT